MFGVAGPGPASWNTPATPGSDVCRNYSHDTSTKDSIIYFLIQQHLSLSADSASSQPVPTACATFQTTLVSGLLSFWVDRQQIPWMRTSSCEKRSVCFCSQGMNWSSGSSACLDVSAVGVFSTSWVTSLDASMTLSGISRRGPMLLFILTVLWSSLCLCMCLTVSDCVSTETCCQNLFFPTPWTSCLSTFLSIWFALAQHFYSHLHLHSHPYV